MKKLSLVAVVSLVLCLLVGSVAAQTSTTYDLSWHVIAGGGETMTSATFTVHATAGQGIIGPTGSSTYQVGAGYWYGVVGGAYAAYLPLVLRND